MATQPPLTGLKVLEFQGLAPGPFAGLLLADAGASVLRIDRAPTPGDPSPPASDLLTRHKSSIAVNLKDPAGIALIHRLASHADVLIDPYRPGVLEKLGLGPTPLLAANPRLIYARLTGFRRDGRFAAMAGHDINYLAVSGALALLGRKSQPPTPPGNLLGDFAGGGAMLVQGVLLALLAREKSGRGQVVEANMVDGAGYLASFPRFARRTPAWDRPRGENLLDTGCPWYEAYETADRGWMAVGALEERFFAELVKGLGLQGQGWERGRWDRKRWPELRGVLERTFRSRTREEWEAVFEGTDACCTPIYGYEELEGDKSGRLEGEQRPPVTLRETPLLAVKKDARDASQGQGEGVEGEGHVGYPLEAGQGGEERLKEWFGWSKGEEFEVKNGGLVLNADGKAKL
ncbi:CoA-transferase family III domain-containing protein [Staphylotrichum tortipilum]|uniref:CoA-transferase family III domain-containing protein n=1 Tax=Staphylotrichum tortipilum TaxID=2831512 RepID=A0AAN6MV57_9PEZI|nr:CoA-transferase family III domain-containing protein [Staphylotrichum longicolle]